MSTDRSSPIVTVGRGFKAATFYWGCLIALAFVMIAASQNIGMINQGDYRRAVGRFLEVWASINGQGVNLQGVDWHFRPDPGGPMTGGGSSSLLFWVATVFQRLVSDHYSLLAVALFAKLGLVVVLERLAAALAAFVAWQLRGRLLIASALLLSAFAAHNIAFINSFYMEFAFMLCLPLLLLGMVSNGRYARIWLVLGAGLCGAAKVQYFYVPLLVAGLMLWADRRAGRRLDRGLLIGLVCAQLLALVPLARGDLRQLNYHHATRLGSYLVLEADERKALGVTPEIAACIGVDAWGNRVASASGKHIVSSGHACGAGESLGLSDVLAPYLAYPSLLLRLWRDSAETHFTVSYFHVDANSRYLTATSSDGYGWGRWLMRLSAWRDAAIGPWPALLILVSGCLLAWWPRRSKVALLAPALAFLSLFAFSQLVVSLVGEGVRDLSRHWAGAQFALDVLLVLLVVHLVQLYRASSREGARR